MQSDVRKQQVDRYYRSLLASGQGLEVQPRHYELARLLEMQPRDSSVLDIGCGVGAFLVFLRRQGFLDLTGLDISEVAGKVLQKEGIKFVLSDIETLLVSLNS